MYYELVIKQECKAAPGREAYNVWKYKHEKRATIAEIRELLISIYGKVPFIKGNEVYRDAMEEGAEPIHVGYTYSYWEDLYDRSNPGGKYWATDWIEIRAVIKEPIILTDKHETEEAA